MSLQVGYTISIDSDNVEILNGDGQYLFGFESTRKTWSELRFKPLNLKILTILENDNIQLPVNKFPELIGEFNAIEAIISGDEKEYWLFRFNNARKVMIHILNNNHSWLLFIG